MIADAAFELPPPRPAPIGIFLSNFISTPNFLLVFFNLFATIEIIFLLLFKLFELELMLILFLELINSISSNKSIS